jgi:hypothetical protein
LIGAGVYFDAGAPSAIMTGFGADFKNALRVPLIGEYKLLWARDFTTVLSVGVRF